MFTTHKLSRYLGLILMQRHHDILLRKLFVHPCLNADVALQHTAAKVPTRVGVCTALT